MEKEGEGEDCLIYCIYNYVCTCFNQLLRLFLTFQAKYKEISLKNFAQYCNFTVGASQVISYCFNR